MADKKVKASGLVETVTKVYDEDENLIETRVETAPRAYSSVEISVDSKGNVKPSVKVYHEDPAEALKQAKVLMAEAIRWSNDASAN